VWPRAATSIASTAPVASLITFNADAYTAEVQALLNGSLTPPGFPSRPRTRRIVRAGKANRQREPGRRLHPVALSAAAPSNLGSLSPNWAIGFASDQMVIAYSNATRSTPMGRGVMSGFEGAAKSNATSDWSSAFASLASGMVKVGISDPNADPAGLRGWLVLEAAGSLYAGSQSAYAAPLLHEKANVTGSAAANMVAPLQAGQFQFSLHLQVCGDRPTSGIPRARPQGQPRRPQARG